jgi:1,4-dihydroxy-2-naphthoyl-CoA hydrolase
MDDRKDAAILALPRDIEEEFLSAGVRLRALTSGGELGGRLGINVSEACVERVVGTMPVDGNTQPRGLLHGGASAVLAETLGSIGAMLHARTSRMPVGVELNCTHHRGVRTGKVTGIAVPIHLGRTITTHEIVITDNDGRRICTARLTCLLTELARRS